MRSRKPARLSDEELARLPTGGASYLGAGRHRAVWRRGRYVIKVPLCQQGQIDNFVEKVRSRREPDRMARTRLATFGGITVAIAEYIEPLIDQAARKDLPDWVDYIDCGQVGTDMRGNLKAYDFA